jgi:hypothetical protein
VLAATPNLVDAPPKTESTQAPSGPNVKAYIERQLKSVYDDVLNQPIPDRFLELLNTLDKSADGDKPETEKK